MSTSQRPGRFTTCFSGLLAILALRLSYISLGITEPINEDDVFTL
jgi:hypothetical protein